MVDRLPGSLTVNMGGVVVSFQTAAPGLNLKLAPKYERFASPGPAETTLQVHARSFQHADLGPARFETGFWSFHKLAEKPVFKMHTNNPYGQFRNHVAVLEPDGRTGELFLEEEEYLVQEGKSALEIPPYPLDELLGIQILAGLGGLEVHACGIAATGLGGLLFSGVSGSGKTTTARIWQQAGAGSLLSDERVAVCRRAGRFWLYGTPWHGDGQVSSPDWAPLTRIFIISHAAANQVRPMKPAEAVAALIVRSFLPYWDPDGLAFALEFLDELCQAIPCYELGFIPDESVVDFVRCLSAS
jgi:hypothetical protein